MRCERGPVFVVLPAGSLKSSEPAPERYAITDKGRGWFVVTKNGQEVTKSLREDDLKDFDGMPEEDKAAFVELHKPAE